MNKPEEETEELLEEPEEIKYILTVLVGDEEVYRDQSSYPDSIIRSVYRGQDIANNYINEEATPWTN